MPCEPSLEKKPRRWRRWLVRVALGLFAFVVVILASIWLRLVWEAAKGRKGLAAVIAETDEQDPRWRWEEIEADRQPVPNAENSILVVKKVADSLAGWKPGEIMLPDGQWLYRGDQPSNRRLDEQRIAFLRAELTRHEKTVALAATLKRYPRGRASVQISSDVISTRLPHAQPVREVTWVLDLDADRLAHDGSASLAADRIHAILNAAAGLHDDPILITQLVRIACQAKAISRIERLLGLVELPDQECLELLRHVAAERQDNVLLVAVRGERASMHQLFDNLGQGRLSLSQFQEGGPSGLATWYGAFLYSYRIPEDHAMYLRRLNRLCDLARLPFHERDARWDEIMEELDAAKEVAMTQKRLILSFLHFPGVGKVIQATARMEAALASAETALAVERFRLAHQRWPHSLAELCPALLKSVPLDPFNGKPLHYARHDDGVSVYSVGPDRIDDGGKVLRPRQDGNYDIGLRLYDPAQRNLPALAEPARP